MAYPNPFPKGSGLGNITTQMSVTEMRALGPGTTTTRVANLASRNIRFSVSRILKMCHSDYINGEILLFLLEKMNGNSDHEKYLNINKRLQMQKPSRPRVLPHTFRKRKAAAMAARKAAKAKELSEDDSTRTTTERAAGPRVASRIQNGAGHGSSIVKPEPMAGYQDAFHHSLFRPLNTGTTVQPARLDYRSYLIPDQPSIPRMSYAEDLSFGGNGITDDEDDDGDDKVMRDTGHGTMGMYGNSLGHSYHNAPHGQSTYGIGILDDDEDDLTDDDEDDGAIGRAIGVDDDDMTDYGETDSEDEGTAGADTYATLGAQSTAIGRTAQAWTLESELESTLQGWRQM